MAIQNKMTIQESKEIIKTIEKLEDITILKAHFDEISKKYQLSDSKYPRIGFDITPEDIKELQSKNVFVGDISFELNQVELQTPLEKLLYAVLWKQGNLPKLKHIIEGIISMESDKDNKKDALVFYHFGKFLANKEEPIIDQHVLRAFRIFETEDEKEIEKYRKMESIKDTDLIGRYKTWLKNLPLNTNKDAIFMIDRILMCIGRELKVKK